jgi:hypothetical protein
LIEKPDHVLSEINAEDLLGRFGREQIFETEGEPNGAPKRKCKNLIVEQTEEVAIYLEQLMIYRSGKCYPRKTEQVLNRKITRGYD